MPSQDELNAELLQKSAAALQQMQDQLDSVEESQHEPIAIIGMACRLPGQSDTPEEFWQMLDAARDGVREVPPERWDLDAFYSPDTEAEGKMYTREGGFVDDIDQFDPGIFGITPREAISMDPQQRMLLETSWEALERAGIAPDSLTGTQTGVFVGVSSQDYYQNTMVNRTDINPYSGTGAGLNVATGRISYVLGLQGPNFAVDTACSSSLVALHTAITSLRQGESSLALAGGVNAIINPMNSVYFCKLGALSPDCRCKTFDASANGYVRGEGAGMLVLKRLSDAQEDGDKILAVLRGSAINHDGRSGGLTVPNGLAQKAVLNAALDNARLDPSEVSYIEAHGTGTPLGDPIEMHALIDVFTQERDESDPLVVGSVKTNIGHLESAAGVAGVIKVVLAMQNEKLPKHLHLNELNPHISLDGAPVKFLHDAMDWGRNDEKSRIAGISSFGISGTNAHVIVEEADPYQIEREEPEEADSLPQVLALSARSPQAVAEMAGRLQASLAATPDVPLSHICRTIATGRSVQPIRAAVSADSVSQLSERLKTLARGQTDIGIVSADKPVSGKPKIAFLFSGQGAQYNGMGRELYEQEPVFCEALEQADEALEPYLGCSIIDIMHAEDDERLHDTEFTQPALFALEYALATLWRDWGVEPELVMGHSVGEFAAACISEVLTLDEAAGLIATRGRLMQSLPAGGGMAAIVAKADDVKTWIEPYAGRLEIAAANAPRNTVVSGELAALEELVDALTDKDVRVSQLRVSHAFHSHLLEPMLGELKDAADKLTHRQPVMRYISNLTGTAITQESLNGDYWANHARQPVLFEKGIQAAADAGIDCFIEIGPHATLISMAQQCVAQPDVHWLASLKRNADDLTAMNETLGALHVKGVNVAWENVYAYVDAEPVILPTYPFERETYWIERRSALTSDNNVFATSAGGDHALLGQRLQTAGRDILFQCALNTRTHPWLVDHAVSGQPIFPATGYLEIALAAARVLKPEHDYVLEQIAFEMPLALQQESSAIVQTVLRPDGSSGDLEFEIFSLKDEQSGEWQRHALGRMVKSTANSLQINVEELQVNLSKRHDAQQNYAQMSAAGMEYGPAFQGVTQLQSGDGESFAHITCPESLSNVGMSLHPALLDACLQALGVTFEVEDGDSLFLPVALDQLAVYRQELPDAFVCHTKLTETTSDTLTGEVLLMSESGDLFARLESLRLRKTSLSKVKRMLGSVQKSVSHELSWVEKPLELSGESVTDKILVLSDKHGVGDKCIAAFNKLAGDSSADIVSLSLDEQASVEDIQDAITSAIGDDKKAHVLATFGCDLMALAEQTGSNRQTIEAASQMTSQLLLNLAQALARIDTKTLAFTLVTSGAQAVAQGPCITQPEASLLWGMGRVMQSEMPMVNTVLCDLDPGDMANSINGLMQQLQTPHTEAHVCWRHGVRFAQRLGAAAEPLGKTELVQLQIPQRGELSDLVLAQVESQQPGPDQVKIAVRATGLNFRDVLNALGMYPGDPGPLGGECAGTIIALGEKVTGFNIGDRVTGIAPGSFRTEVLADSRQVAVIPLEMDFASAATLPITFLTAHYALNRLGKMKKGERVLIHAAAGGVGQAAVQLAKNAELEIFATAGNDEKRALLKRQGVQHIMDSRSTEFAEQINDITNGEGVDLVLNSLVGEALHKSLGLLRTGGRFLEIGKMELLDEDALKPWPNVEYHRIALDSLSAEVPALVGDMLKELMESFFAGSLRPLSWHGFALEQAEEAYRFMQHAKHIGKIVLTQSNPEGAKPAPRADGTYLITGGLGGIGLVVAKHLAETGAGCLALMGRRAPSEDAQAKIAELEAMGCRVEVVQADVAQATDLESALGKLMSSGVPPLRGVYHAAGVLDDGAIGQQTAERFNKVFAPKVQGAWNLHDLTLSQPIDMFVLFSSAAAVMGAAGQSNYAAANSYLDALAHYRKARGLAATSINWGAWSGAGMAAALEEEDAWEARGMETITPEYGMELLDQSVASDAAQLMMMPIDWNQFLAQLPPQSHVPLLSDIVDQQSGAGQATEQVSAQKLMTELEELPEAMRRDRVQEVVEEHLLRILGMSPGSYIDAKQPFTDQGVDSLMAVEMRNSLARAVDTALPATLLFDYPSVVAVTGYLAEEVLELGSAESVEDADGATPSTDDLAAEELAVEALDGDELEASLEDELRKAGF